MSLPTTIYVLRDPISGEIRYVGKTVRAMADRLRGHIQRSMRKRTHRDCWIAGLMARGQRPLIEAIETAGDDWAARESFWIQHFRRAGFRLTNQTDGGEGAPGAAVGESTRALLSVRQKERMQDPSHRISIGEQVARSWTDERRRRKSQETSARHTAEERERMSALQRTPEMLARQRAAQARFWTPEQRAARAEKVRSQMTPERIAAHAQKVKATTADPEWKREHAARERAKWTPEMRAAQAERTRAQFRAKKEAQSKSEQP